MRPRDAVAIIATVAACAFDAAGGSGGFTPSTSTSTGSSSDAVEPIDSTDTTAAIPGPTVDSTTGDAQDGTSGDTGTDSPVEDLPFGDPVPVTELNELAANDEAPTLSGDQLEIFFASDRDGQLDIFTATRASVDAPWSNPIPVFELNSVNDDTSPELTGDGTTLLMISNRAASTDVYMSIRRAGQPWQAPQWVAELSSSSIEYGPTPVPGSDLVLLCSNRPSGFGASDIYETMILRDGGFAPLLPVNVSTTDDECAMSMRADQRELVFASDRAGGPGGGDLWHTSRDIVGQPFEPSSIVDGINTSAVENDPWLAEDGRTLYFASTRAGPTTDLYVARRPQQ